MGSARREKIKLSNKLKENRQLLMLQLEMMGDKIGEENVEEFKNLEKTFRNLTNLVLHY